VTKVDAPPIRSQILATAPFCLLFADGSRWEARGCAGWTADRRSRSRSRNGAGGFGGAREALFVPDSLVASWARLSSVGGVLFANEASAGVVEDEGLADSEASIELAVVPALLWAGQIGPRRNGAPVPFRFNSAPRAGWGTCRRS
jgi:hypothetical protein